MTAYRIARMIKAGVLGLTLLSGGMLITTPQPASADEAAKMLLVLDSSGSMKEKSDGEVKIDSAKKALDTTVDGLPPTINVGLRVFGAKVFNRTDKGACSDSQLVVPVGADNKTALKAAIKNYKPYGETPISYALSQGAKDLGSSGKRTMVLVSDGESTCDPDPCDVASSLTKKDQNLAIDVIGLNVNGAAKDQLKCIASRGKGSYYDASDADTLANSLQTLAQRGSRPFQVSGAPVTGGTDAAHAPNLTAGEYSEELPATGAGDLRYYNVYRKIVGSTLHVSASINRLGRPDAISTKISTPDGQQCAVASDFRADAFGSNILSAASSVGAQTGTSPVQACTDATHLVLEVRHSDKVDGASTYGGKQAVQTALTVTEEPPVSTTSGLPKATTASTFTPKFGGSATSAVPGSSFDDAPTLKSGNYSSNLVPGETQVFLVKQDWGQDVNATLTFPGATGKLANQLGNGDIRANITMFSPNRGAATTNRGGQENVLSKGRLVLGTSSTPVRYLNRTQQPAKASSYLPGSYAIVVSLSADPQNQSYVVPYLLNLDVQGKKSGAPQYVQNPSPAPAPPSDPPVSDGGASTGPTAGGGSVALPIGIGAGVIVVAGAAAAVWWRRRRRTRSGSDSDSDAPA